VANGNEGCELGFRARGFWGMKLHLLMEGFDVSQNWMVYCIYWNPSVPIKNRPRPPFHEPDKNQLAIHLIWAPFFLLFHTVSSFNTTIKHYDSWCSFFWYLHHHLYLWLSYFMGWLCLCWSVLGRDAEGATSLSNFKGTSKLLPLLCEEVHLLDFHHCKDLMCLLGKTPFIHLFLWKAILLVVIIYYCCFILWSI